MEHVKTVQIIKENERGDVVPILMELRKFMKKIVLKVLLAIIIIGLIAGLVICLKNYETKKSSGDKIKIVATLFPQYDFARIIGGDKVEVSMLLPAGTEAHSYDPTPTDMININDSDIFIYTGKYMETWVANMIDSFDSKVNVLDVSNGIELEKHEHDHEEEEEEHEHEEEHEEEHHHEYDPHIWTSPVKAKAMCKNIYEELCNVDPENSEYYTKNYKDYIAELDKLDSDIKEMVNTSKRKKIVSGSRFAMNYFVEEYGIEFQAAYDSCNTEAEPSVRTISALINIIKTEKIPVIYYEELTVPTVAKSISEVTGTKMLLLHSAHNVSKEDFESGITYLSIMRQNLANLKEGLN